MKLILAIVQDQFVNKVTRSLMEQKIRVTRLSSSGGFLNSGSTTLLIGSEEDELDQVINLIKENCKTLKVNNHGQEVSVGGANIFIVDMNKFLRV